MLKAEQAAQKQNEQSESPSNYAEKITLGMVYSTLKTKADGCIFAKHTSPSRLCPVGRNISAVLDKSYGKIEKRFDKDLETITLADILADYHLRLREENKK